MQTKVYFRWLNDRLRSAWIFAILGCMLITSGNSNAQNVAEQTPATKQPASPSSTIQAPSVSYFRQDFGIASGSNPLPADFEKDAKLVWKVPLASGHSTPCVQGDSIFVTTYQTDKKQLATVALERTSGKVRWENIAPTETIEAVHATGSPASSSPASNGKQVFAFFGSYGMLCYDWKMCIRDRQD